MAASAQKKDPFEEDLALAAFLRALEWMRNGGEGWPSPHLHSRGTTMAILQWTITWPGDLVPCVVHCFNPRVVRGDQVTELKADLVRDFHIRALALRAKDEATS